jgi:hypothetical protein
MPGEKNNAQHKKRHNDYDEKQDAAPDTTHELPLF